MHTTTGTITTTITPNGGYSAYQEQSTGNLGGLMNESRLMNPNGDYYPQPCPGCGRCPTCGRGGSYFYPRHPYQWETAPAITGTEFYD